MATGETVDVALNGDRSLPPIRGGSQEAIFKVNQLSKPKRSFTLKIVVEENNQDYLYTIITAAFSLQIRKEFIEWGFQNKAILNQNDRFYSSQRSCLFTRNFKLSNYDSINGVDSRTVLKNKPNVDIDNYQKLEAVKSDKYPDFYSQLKAVKSDEFINKFSSELRSILIINPLPDRMRDYSKLSENLESDASNIAGVLAALPDEKKLEVESTLSHYLEHFPEGDIKKIWAEKVGRLGTDAMLYCQEEWQPGQITEIDARSMSDGTLRLLGILTALLTRPEGSLIVIEEIDNGLHPSRAELLVKILREIGTKRKIDLLITTHNPALLDALGPEIIPFVTVVHRDAETGESKLTLLEDIENLPKLLATGSLGQLATKGTIEKTLAKSI
jgi:predicted ATPase